MFATKNRQDAGLDKAIDALLVRLADTPYDPTDYPKMVDQLTKLYKLKEQNAPWRPSADTLLLVGGNLVGILLIIGYERVNVVTSKALGFVLRLR